MSDMDISKISWDAIQARKARTSLLDFTTYTFPNYKVNWHHKIVCKYLEKWVAGEITRLMIFSPPRSGKPTDIDSEILMSDKSYKLLKDVVVGDIILDGFGNDVLVTDVFEQGKLETKRITSESGMECIAAYDHPFLTTNGWKTVGELSTDDLLVSNYNNISSIESIRSINYNGKSECRCLGVTGTHTFVADGFVVHNSELVSRRLPAWIFGKYPDSNIIASSYNMDLASKMNRDVQHIIDTPEYRNAFPGVGLTGRSVRTVIAGNSYLRNTEIFEIVNHKGVYKASGVGTGITGLGFDFGLIDDPVKDRKEAESKAVQDTTWDWYRSVFYTRRMDNNSRILLTLTRWSQQDLAGKLLELSREDPNADQWTVLSLPMIAEDPLHPEDPRKVGEPLWPERFSMESLLASRSVMGMYDWAALMQQNPIASGGVVFSREWLTNFYEDDPKEVAKNMEELLQSWDMTFAGGDKSDFVVGQVWGRKGADRYLLDQVRFQGDFTQTEAEFKLMSAKWPYAVRKLVEKKANGDAIISRLKNVIPGIIPVTPLGGKSVRAQAVAPIFESGNVYLPIPKYAPWINDFIDELAIFPNGKKDDQVDAASQSLANMLTRVSVPTPPKIPNKVVTIGSDVNKLFSPRVVAGRRNRR